METISKALWGSGENQQGQEPISGQQGSGTVNEPYDRGNEESTGLNGLQTKQEHSGSTSAVRDETAGAPVTGQQPIQTEQSRDGPSNAIKGEATGDPTSGQQSTPKQQGADRPSEEPKKDDIQSKMPHTDEEREKMMESGDFPHDPNDHSGEPIHMHGGEEVPPKNDTQTEGKKDRSASVAHEGGGPHGGNKGTGEQYVKSSGIHAEGGDFDAKNPGAGAEANRLLEEHGIHKEKDTRFDDDGAPVKPAADAEDTTKVSKIQKIKEKLHIGKSS
jgi:hypothetical protein